MLLECQRHGKSQKRRLESSLPHGSFPVGCIVIIMGKNPFLLKIFQAKFDSYFQGFQRSQVATVFQAGLQASGLYHLYAPFFGVFLVQNNSQNSQESRTAYKTNLSEAADF